MTEQRPAVRAARRISAVQLAAALGRPEPTAEQRAVIESPLSPTLVVAGAGSGKTETMSQRVLWLVATGLLTPDQVLGLTFTRKAAGELAERVRRQLRLLRQHGLVAEDLPTLWQPTVATYNSYAAAIVRDHALRLGTDPDATVVSDGARWQLARSVIESYDDGLDTDYSLGSLTAALLSLSDAMAEHLLTPEQAAAGLDELIAVLAEAGPDGRKTRLSDGPTRALRSLAARRALAPVVRRYAERKRELAVMDYADQVAIAARLATGVPQVGAGERARFAVVLLDEYQDTSVAQLELLRALYGGGHPVMAVGDPHQSIYGWRGASPGGLAGFPLSFPTAGGAPAARLTLSTAWRNDTAVLAVANRLAAPLRAAEPMDVPALTARPGAGVGSVTAAYLPTVDDEARYVAEMLTADWWQPNQDGGPQRTAAVLCRKRSQFPPLVAALRRAGLPVEVVGLGGLLSTPEVVDVVALLQAVHDPSRGDSLMRLLTNARYRIGAADLQVLGDWARHLARDGRQGAAPRAGTGAVVAPDVADERSIVDAVAELPPEDWADTRGHVLSPAARQRMGQLAELLAELRAQTYLPVPDLVVQAERALGLDIELAARAGSGAGRAHLDVLVDVAGQFAAGTDSATLGAFLDWLQAAQEHERGLEPAAVEPDTGTVQVLTVHAAKGLEWDVVAVPGLSDATFPAVSARPDEPVLASGWLTELKDLPGPLRKDADRLPALDLSAVDTVRDVDEVWKAFRAEQGAQELADERRVGYVAVTRARSRLALSGAWWSEAGRPRPPSIFLRELGLSADGSFGAGQQVPVDVSAWAAPPADDETNPMAGRVVSAVWPVPDLLGQRRATVESAAELVSSRMPAGAGLGRLAGAAAARDLLTEAGRSAVAEVRDWAQLAEVLLAERDRPPAAGSMRLPEHLSVSATVAMARDADAFAVALRRPVPVPPSEHARRGTDFHSWVEGYFRRPALLDADDLAERVAADLLPAEESVALDVLERNFLASPWAQRQPLAVETPFETPLAGMMLRGRIDAVFPDGDGVVVVDWKSGRPAADRHEAEVRELQLAVYRIAWSRISGLPLHRVGAEFFFAATGERVPATAGLGVAEVEALLRERLA